MPRFLIRHIVLLLLVVLTTNMVVWGCSPDLMKHELLHVAAPQLTADHEHGQPSSQLAGKDGKSLASLHQVLHAVDHLQIFPDTSARATLGASAASGQRPFFAEVPVPFTVLDPPFRPPQSRTLFV